MRQTTLRHLLLSLAGTILLGVIPVLGTDYYAAPGGDDTHTGLGADDAHAFRTLQHGVNLLKPGDRLLARAGIYRETVTFPKDGEPGAPIVLMAYPGEKPLISGLEPLTEWKSAGDNRWTTSMPWSLGLGRDQLFKAGQPLNEARYPSKAADDLVLLDEKGHPLPAVWPTFGHFSIPDRNAPYTVKCPPGPGFPTDYWKGAIYVGLHAEGYDTEQGVVTANTSDTLTLNPISEFWHPNPALPFYGSDEGRGMLVGHPHALTAADQWVRATDGTLTLQLAPGEVPAGLEAKRRQLGLDLRNRLRVEVRGLALLGCSATLYNASGCALEGCTLSWYCHYIAFHHSYNGFNGDYGASEKAGESGVYLGGWGNTVRDCVLSGSAGGGVILDGRGHLLHNNLIEHIGYSGIATPAVLIQAAQYNLNGGHRVTRNTLRYVGRANITVLGLGGFLISPQHFPEPFEACLFEGNLIHTGMLLSRDGGLLYVNWFNGAGWNSRRTLFRRNVAYDCRDSRNVGILYLDAGCWGYEFQENLVWDPPGTTQQVRWWGAPTMNSVWGDSNRFFAETSLDPEHLEASRFPGGIPFAFGRDETRSPAVPDFPEARRHTAPASRVLSTSPGVTRSGGQLGNWHDGDWAVFRAPHLAAWKTLVVGVVCDEDFSANRSLVWFSQPVHHRHADPLVLAADVSDSHSERVWFNSQNAIGLGNLAWLCYKDVPLEVGFKRVRLLYASAYAGQKWVELHLDSPAGPLVSRITLTESSGVALPPGNLLVSEAVAIGELSPEATGTHDLYVVVRSDDPTGDELAQIAQANLEDRRVPLPLTSEELRLELHARDKDGPLLGWVRPYFTDKILFDWAALADMSAVDPAEDRLCLVVRTSLPNPGLKVSYLRLEGAEAP